MQFSQVNVIKEEEWILANRREVANKKFVSRLVNFILYPRNPKHTFNFYVPRYLFLRGVSFAEDIAYEIGDKFDIGDLVAVLYKDFLEYVRKTNNLHNVYTRLTARDLSPTSIKPYQSEEAYSGVIFEELRGFEEVKTRIEHKDALRGEFLLRDMLDIYQDHTFTLENILEIVYCDFVDDYRKGLIKRPIQKIVQYL